MSWMSFRTNLSRQQPRIIRVGEIAQLIVLHAELAVAAVRGQCLVQCLLLNTGRG